MHPDHDLPTNDVPYSIRERVLAAIMLAVMAAGAWQAVGALRTPETYEKLPKSAADFTEGRTTLALEKSMDEHLPARESIVALANAARYLLLRGTGDDVRAGRDGWLFLTEELRYDPPTERPLEARVAMLADAHAALRAQDVRLLVALVPDKARMYPHRLLRGGYPDYNVQRYRQALEGLRARGVETVDLLTPLREAAVADAAGAGADADQAQLYYRTDTHWNTRGAAIAARHIAAAAYPEGGCEPQTRYRTQIEGETRAYAGDLRRMIGLEQMPAWFPPRSDFEAPVSTVQIAQPQGDEASSGLGLFDEVSVPVVLTGTSFSLRGNFHGALQQALGCTVLNTAQDGGGFLTSATQYFKDEAFVSTKPAIVIWELPERFLTQALGKEASFLRDAGLRP